MLAAIGRALRRVFRVGAATPSQKAAAASPSPSRGAAASEPQYRSLTEWTPQHIRAALRWTDSGELRLAAELCDALLGDDRIQSAFSTRVGGLLGSPLDFEQSASPGGLRQRKRALKALEAGEDWWEICPEDELTRLIVWGLLLGVAFAQLRTERSAEHGGRLIPRLHVWHPRWFRWDHTAQCWFVWTSENRWVRIHPGDGEWVVFTPYGRSRPWAHGLWRGLAVLWLLKVYALRDWGRYSEAHGQPAWVITAESDDYRRRKELADLFGDLGRNPCIALPKGFSADLVEATANTWETFDAQLQLANRGFAVAIVGGNLAVEVDRNQQTGANAQTLVRIDYKRRDAASVSTLTHDQILVWWAAWNFGEGRFAPWPAWNVEPPEDRHQAANTWFTVAKAVTMFRKAGVVIDLQETAERFAIPILGETEPEDDEAEPDRDVAKDDVEGDTQEGAKP